MATRGASGMGGAGAGDVYASWKESRRAMADYEEKLQLMSFEVSRDTSLLKDIKTRSKQMNADLKETTALKTQFEDETLILAAQLEAVYRDAGHLDDEAGRSAQQLRVILSELARLQAASAIERDNMGRHLDEQRTFIDELYAFRNRTPPGLLSDSDVHLDSSGEECASGDSDVGRHLNDHAK